MIEDDRGIFHDHRSLFLVIKDSTSCACCVHGCIGGLNSHIQNAESVTGRHMGPSRLSKSTCTDSVHLRPVCTGAINQP